MFFVFESSREVRSELNRAHTVFGRSIVSHRRKLCYRRRSARVRSAVRIRVVSRENISKRCLQALVNAPEAGQKFCLRHRDCPQLGGSYFFHCHGGQRRRFTLSMEPAASGRFADPDSDFSQPARQRDPALPVAPEGYRRGNEDRAADSESQSRVP